MNRPVLREIDRIEQEMTGHWKVEIDELTALAAEEQAREKFMQPVKPQPGLLRRWVAQIAFAIYRKARA
jgi:hypothetical protein